MLQRYAVERFLYRLSASDEVDRFTLKGAALLRMWVGQELRPTRDIDFLARGARDENRYPHRPCGTSAAFPVERTASSSTRRRSRSRASASISRTAASESASGAASAESGSWFRSTSGSATSLPSAAGKRTTPLS